LSPAFFFRFSSKHAPPKYRLPLVLLAFFVSILWIYMTANELVAVLKFFGVAFNISTGILGLTVLAWGNSIGDFVANTVVARQGFPEMAISAAFGGPLFNTVFGLGMAVTYANIVHYPNAARGREDHESVADGVYVSRRWRDLTSLIVIPLTKFVIKRWYAGVLITIYIAATTCGLLAEFGILDFGLGRTWSRRHEHAKEIKKTERCLLRCLVKGGRIGERGRPRNVRNIEQ
jgi:sodium/potassium/calcium exchanger 6